ADVGTAEDWHGAVAAKGAAGESVRSAGNAQVACCRIDGEGSPDVCSAGSEIQGTLMNNDRAGRVDGLDGESGLAGAVFDKRARDVDRSAVYRSIPGRVDV